MRFTDAVKILVSIKILILLSILAVEMLEIRIGDVDVLAKDEQKNKEKDVYPEEAERKSNSLRDFLELKPLNEDDIEMKKISAYIQIAERSRQEVENKMKKMSLKEEQLKKLQAAIEKQIISLEEEREYIRKTIQKEKKINKERLEVSVQLYSKMDPKKAAGIFETLDKDFVIELINKIKKKQITAILELLPPEKAKEITEYYARVGSAREYDLLKEMNISLQKAFNECKEPERS